MFKFWNYYLDSIALKKCFENVSFFVAVKTHEYGSIFGLKFDFSDSEDVKFLLLLKLERTLFSKTIVLEATFSQAHMCVNKNTYK